MYRNSKTGQILSDDDVDQIVSSWAARGIVGRPRECVVDDLRESGFEYVEENVDERFVDPVDIFD